MTLGDTHEKNFVGVLIEALPEELDQLAARTILTHAKSNGIDTSGRIDLVLNFLALKLLFQEPERIYPRHDGSPVQTPALGTPADLRIAPCRKCKKSRSELPRPDTACPPLIPSGTRCFKRHWPAACHGRGNYSPDVSELFRSLPA